MKMTIEEKKQLCFEYIKARPALKISILAQEAGIPDQSMYQAYHYNRTLADKHIEALYNHLTKRYGLKR